MRAMKDSGIEWMGEIPENWKSIKLCFITSDIFLGRTPVYSEEPNENYIVGQKNNQPYGISLDGMKYGEDVFYSSVSDNEFLKFGDTLLNTLGGGSVGRIGFWNLNDSNRYLTDGHLMIIRPKDLCDNRFLFYAMFTQQKLLEDEAVGSTNQAFLTIKQIYKRMVPFPCLPEQQAISTFLDCQCANIENIVVKTKASINEYKKLRQAVITQAVTKGIRENRKMKESGSIWFGSIPVEWNTKRLKYQFHIKKDIAGEEGHTVLSITQKGIIPKDLSKNEGQLAESYANYQLVNVGDFAMNHMDLLTGWVDISRYEGVTSPDYRVFVLDDAENNHSQYFLYLMQMCYSNRIFYGLGQGVSGLGRWRLQADKFLNFVIPIPPVEEQIEIATYLDQKCSEIDNLIAKKEQFLTELENYKKTMIYEYVTGKKEVPQS